MMILIFSIIVTCPHLCSVCKVFQVLKDTYFKGQVSVVAPKYSIWDIENNSKKFESWSMFKQPQWKKQGL